MLVKKKSPDISIGLRNNPLFPFPDLLLNDCSASFSLDCSCWL